MSIENDIINQVIDGVPWTVICKKLKITRLCLQGVLSKHGLTAEKIEEIRNNNRGHRVGCKDEPYHEDEFEYGRKPCYFVDDLEGSEREIMIKQIDFEMQNSKQLINYKRCQQIKSGV